jgi:hypothetical protein
MIVQRDNPKVRFLLFCAGSSTDLLQECPNSEWIKHTAIGMAVFFTSVLAFISSFFALYVVFGSVLVCLPLALLWSLIILNLDRFIVSSFRKSGQPWKEFLQAVPRLLLAVVIALVIAKPLEMQIFRTEVEQILGEQKLAKMSAMQDDHERRLTANDKRVGGLKAELDRYFTLKEQYYRDYICECDGTCGTGIQGRGSECQAKQAKYEAFVAEFEREKSRIEASLADLKRERDLLTGDHQKDKAKVEQYFSFGFLARLNALQSLDSLSSLFITLLFILIEAAPVLSKLLSPLGPYDNLIRMSENEYQLKYMRFVYQQNMELHAARSASPPAEGKRVDKERRDDNAEAAFRYAELRRQLQRKYKHN